jgi:hypothetical protein
MSDPSDNLHSEAPFVSFCNLHRCTLRGCTGAAPGAALCPHVLQLLTGGAQWAQEMSSRLAREYQAHGLAELAARQDPACLGAPPTGALRAWAGVMPRVPQYLSGIPVPAASWRDRQDPALPAAEPVRAEGLDQVVQPRQDAMSTGMLGQVVQPRDHVGQAVQPQINARQLVQPQEYAPGQLVQPQEYAPGQLVQPQEYAPIHHGQILQPREEAPIHGGRVEQPREDDAPVEQPREDDAPVEQPREDDAPIPADQVVQPQPVPNPEGDYPADAEEEFEGEEGEQQDEDGVEPIADSDHDASEGPEAEHLPPPESDEMAVDSDAAPVAPAAPLSALTTPEAFLPFQAPQVAFPPGPDSAEAMQATPTPSVDPQVAPAGEPRDASPIAAIGNITEPDPGVSATAEPPRSSGAHKALPDAPPSPVSSGSDSPADHPGRTIAIGPTEQTPEVTIGPPGPPEACNALSDPPLSSDVPTPDIHTARTTPCIYAPLSPTSSDGTVPTDFSGGSLPAAGSRRRRGSRPPPRRHPRRRPSSQKRSFGKAAPRVSRGEAEHEDHLPAGAELPLPFTPKGLQPTPDPPPLSPKGERGERGGISQNQERHASFGTSRFDLDNDPESVSDSGGADPAEPEPQLPESIPDSASTDPEYTQLLLRLRGGAGGDEGEDSDEEEETALTLWEQTKARFELEPDPPPYDELMLDASPPRAFPPPPDPQAGDSFPSISATTSQLSQYQLQALQQQLHQQQMIQQHQQQYQQEPEQPAYHDYHDCQDLEGYYSAEDPPVEADEAPTPAIRRLTSHGSQRNVCGSVHRTAPDGRAHIQGRCERRGPQDQ